MEWTSIEKKWHEMTRRLQNAGSDAGSAAGTESGRRAPLPVQRQDDPGIRDVDMRALA
jgi:hypothetical protein